MKRWQCVALIGVSLVLASMASTAFAHGVSLTSTASQALVVEIDAAYDNGDPMVAAQVMVYAPNDPSQPWMTATTDEQGQFVFVPDQALPGTWEVTVRQSGHGGTTYVEVSDNPEARVATQVAGTGTSYSSFQWVLMGASVVWGFVGTALYFSKGKADAYS